MRRAWIYALRVLGVVLAFGGSFLSIGVFMAGAGPDSLYFASLLWVLYFICGFVVGVCLPRWWYIAIGVAWLPLMLAPEFLGEVVAGIASLEGVMFLSCPFVALLGGYAGSRISGKFFSAPSGAA